MQHPEDRVSPVQDAVLRVQSRIGISMPEDKDITVSARVIVPSSQTGCIIGRGGSVITEMRNLSGAHIRLLSREQSPSYISENEVVVQVHIFLSYLSLKIFSFNCFLFRCLGDLRPS